MVDRTVDRMVDRLMDGLLDRMLDRMVRWKAAPVGEAVRPSVYLLTTTYLSSK